jgi:hypothetical protein
MLISNFVITFATAKLFSFHSLFPGKHDMFGKTSHRRLIDKAILPV